MRRFSLRSILLVAALLPPVIGSVWYFGEFDKVHAGSHEKAARLKLLKHTPPGTSAIDVLEFVVNDLHRSGQGHAYHKYLKQYEADSGRNADLYLTPTDYLYSEKRVIEVVVSSRPAGFLVAHEVRATWHFDDQDRLVDITTMEYGIGP